MLLDFNTKDLLSCLDHWLAVEGAALQWFHSYLAERSYCVNIGHLVSYSTSALWGTTGFYPGVPSILTLFVSLGLRKPGISFHCYADD